MTIFQQTKLTESRILGEKALQISASESMPTFLMHLITSGDIWAFIGSNHAITAGRKNPDQALFPYYTEDKIFDMVNTSGSMSVIKSGSTVWAPFEQSLVPREKVTQWVLKSVSGTKICLEEYHRELNLSIHITWTSSEEFGLVRMAEIKNHSDHQMELDVLDGLLNIMPPGVDQNFQNEFSNLTDAYKRSEWLESNLAAYSLSSIPTDKAEPNEGLRSTTVWSTGFPIKKHFLTEQGIKTFVLGQKTEGDFDSRGRRGCYLMEGSVILEPGKSKSWWMAADLNQSANKICSLLEMLRGKEDPALLLRSSVEASTQKLDAMVSKTDGIQVTNLKRNSWRHFSNTLFNTMRGGTFPKEYRVPKNDFLSHVKIRNKGVFEKSADWLSQLPKDITILELKNLVEEKSDKDLIRITSEYLPLSFSRRHGDPSRPWNRFSIEVTDESGNEKYAYQGNWRDIFQNWEALLHSFPQYTDSVISRFLNTTTFDGYNPYRITQDGFEWEHEEPGSPWSNIGYWGDHQIIYLLKLLEWSQNTQPDNLLNKLNEERFAFAAVPYCIKPFEAIIENARSSIIYDQEWSNRIDEAVSQIGADGQLLTYSTGEIVYGTLAEKLLVPLLAKLSNFIPGAGIWMNTQRPEWNDANNALVGYGASVVTLGYVLRYVRFLRELLSNSTLSEFNLHADVLNFLNEIKKSLNGGSLSASHNATVRGDILKKLGKAGSDFREKFYSNGVSEERAVISRFELIKTLETFELNFKKTLEANKRADGLYHAYSLLRINSDESVDIEYLTLMLEGQVSILSSGLLSQSESIELLDKLETSALYRKDQNSYMLYPDRELPDILSKAVVDDKLIEKSPFLKEQLDSGKSGIIEKGADGKIRFNGDLRNAAVLEEVLHPLSLSDSERNVILDTYEETFKHHTFTGRSRSFFAYEGLGSIYWHMVSKLSLAVQEILVDGEGNGTDTALIDSLLHHFRKIQEGIGINKEPTLYGAFPTDAYSHTPAHAGAQQPGMTGQVKEDFLVRLAELGVRIRNGRISFSPTMLNRNEFLEEASEIQYADMSGKFCKLPLSPDSLAFTLCNTPVVYKHSDNDETQLTLVYKDRTECLTTTSLSPEESASVFAREGKILRIEVNIPKIVSLT